MNLEQLEKGPFDTVEAIQFLAKTLRGLVASAPLPAPLPASLPDHVFYRLLDDRVARALLAAGINDIEDVRRASDEELREINGVGPSTLRTLREVFK